MSFKTKCRNKFHPGAFYIQNTDVHIGILIRTNYKLCRRKEACTHMQGEEKVGHHNTEDIHDYHFQLTEVEVFPRKLQ